MLTKQTIASFVLKAIQELGIEVPGEAASKIVIDYPEPELGDYTSNAALMLAKAAKLKPQDLAQKIVEKLDKSQFEKIEVAGPGFINFFVHSSALIKTASDLAKQGPEKFTNKNEKILVEYFQPNIAKPMHIGLLRNAVIGDALARFVKYLGYHVESDTHMGDWGTQFGLLILAYKKYGDHEDIAKDPINKLNELYIKINQEIDNDPDLRDQGKQEFVKLEQGDSENRKIWQQFVDWSMEKFLKINDLMGILPFDHHWPESFYEDKMPEIITTLKQKGLLVESQGAQIVNLSAMGGSASGGEDTNNLGVAVVIKSDGGTTYLLRDLATFIYRKSLGFTKQIYVVDTRQSHAFRQLFKILELMGEMSPGEAIHIDYGYISFKGEVLSTRKGNMVLVEDVIRQAEEKVSRIIEEKNPDLNDKARAIKVIAQGALKYYDLSHNRHSDIEFDWDTALDFNGNSGPYLQYSYARLSSILRKAEGGKNESDAIDVSPTERHLMFELTKFNDIVADSTKDYLPNMLAEYLYRLATLINKFYQESPVIKETDEAKRQFRLTLIGASRKILKQGMDLLGITALEEM